MKSIELPGIDHRLPTAPQHISIANSPFIASHAACVLLVYASCMYLLSMHNAFIIYIIPHSPFITCGALK